MGTDNWNINNRSLWITSLVLMLLMTSCSITRYIPDGEAILVGNNLTLKVDTLQPHKPHSTLAVEMEEMLRPIPNSTIFGYPFKVWMYYSVGNPRRKKGLRNWVRRKLGEEPVFITQRTLALNKQILESHLHNEGYFKSSVTSDVKIQKKKRAEANYTAYVRPRYTIEEATVLSQGTSEFTADFKEAEKGTLLKSGMPYRLEVIEAERIRIDQYLKTKGYYYFSPEHLIVKIDSSLNNHKIRASIELKPTVAQTALKRYFISDVKVYTNYQGAVSDSLTTYRTLRGGGKLFDPEETFRNRVFNEVIGFKPGSVYSSQVQDITLARVVNLKNFKFVKNKFELLPRSDSALLEVHYQLSPFKRKSMRAELSALTKSNNLGGVQGNVSWAHKNLFRGAEQLRIGADIGLDWQIGGGKIVTGTNFLRYKAEAELTFPRFIVPYWKYTPEKDQSLPRTSLTLSYENLVQSGLYTLNSMRGNWGYTWQFKQTTQHTFSPFGINIVRPRNISEAFKDLIFATPNEYDWDRYFRILENRLILESQYSISYSPIPKPYSRHQVNLSGGINLVGNIAGLFVRKKNEDGTKSKELFGIPYEQFVRADGEARYYYTVSPTLKWANRVFAGFGLPYGNSVALPQFKQYFSGGSTGIRAFQARTLGPGGYHADSTTRAIFRNTQFGDIKLELNSELRFKLTSMFHTAVFVDAGNVWNYNHLAEYGEHSVFKKDFYKQIAVGGGVGLRLDFSYLVFRLDLATPFRKPWLAYGEEKRSSWVLKDIDLRDKNWRRENLVLNIAVAYPF